MPWTMEQQQVIDARNRNLLVSAAAGAGKTAVLVERIISMILDPDHPIDVGELLVVTFTNAAASEMRERIGKAIEKAIGQDPANEHLIRQLSEIHQAHIMTIDSFCLQVVRDHFHLLDLDPGFRIGEEAELQLIRQDTMAQVMEECYEGADPDFLLLVDAYSAGRSDQPIEDMIWELYQVARSSPQPSRWLRKCRENLQARNPEELDGMSAMALLKEHIRMLLSDLEAMLRAGCGVCEEENGPAAYEDTIRDDLRLVRQLMNCETIREYCAFFSEPPKYARLSGKKQEHVDEKKKQFVQEVHNRCKEVINDCYQNYFSEPVDAVLDDIKAVAAPMNGLLDATERFMERFQENKLAQNVLYFDDVEHFALRLLAEFDEDGKARPSAVAKELGRQFYEIFIDEYQDSNEIQEAILTSVSKIHQGQHNMFMVGDVKQSIYKFRLAKPEIFMEKYNAYTLEDGPEQKIELRKNFRSRASVLESVNALFYRIMRKELGGIPYTPEVALDPGRTGEEQEELDDKTELLLLDVAENGENDAADEYTDRELEAHLIAERIHRLVDGQTAHRICDKETGQYRNARYGDIVILLRTVSGWAEVFEAVLSEEGIPSCSDSQKGYFDAVEVRTMLDLLTVVDNPYNDIPLVSAMRSPIGGFNGEDLAIIKVYAAEHPGGDGSFYTALLSFAESGGSGGTSEKAARFLALLERLDRAKLHMDLGSLLWYALTETGYYHMAGAMPNGKQRQANLRMLVRQAEAYEATNYRGLFRFVRYMAQIREYQVDYGEARVSEKEQDRVRIMSIHKSKGLEFPIVFVSGLHKKFNMRDTSGTLVVHPDYFLGSDRIDPALRTRDTTLMKAILRNRLQMENLGEELRVLYVALTRAREKLILTGIVRDYGKQSEQYRTALPSGTDPLPYFVLTRAKKYLDWILAALPFIPSDLINVRVTPLSRLVFGGVEHMELERATREDLKQWKPYVGAERLDEIKNRFYWRYPYEEQARGKGKYSVSEWKVLGQNIDDADAEHLIPHPVENPAIPEFRKEERTAGAARRGTILHEFMEMLDFSSIAVLRDVEDALAGMEQKGFLTPEERSVIDTEAVLRFFYSDLGDRAARAAEDGRLYKEVQYMQGIPMNELDPACGSDEPVLIQGIIDGYFIEDDSIVLFDYKTDHIAPGQEKMLAERYAVQLRLYEKALEAMTGRKVKEKYLYSFCLHRAIPVR